MKLLKVREEVTPNDPAPQKFPYVIKDGLLANLTEDGELGRFVSSQLSNRPSLFPP